MIVVLILMSIVIGLAYTVLSLVQKQMYGIQDNFNKHTELNTLETSLWLDFNRFHNVKYNALEDELIFNNALNATSYKFTKDYVIKDLDTFNVKLKYKELFFNGNSIKNGFVDAIKLEGDKVFQNQRVFVFKRNDATSYIK